MKNVIIFLLVSIFSFVACEKDDSVDTEKPVIDLSIDDAFPKNCDTLYLGESFTLKLKLSDNNELGSFSIDIHHNFDHHSHSTEITECDLGEKKQAVNPFALNQKISIPEGQINYILEEIITIPGGNKSVPYDTGDYHLYLSLTDIEGWSTQKGLSIKILARK